MCMNNTVATEGTVLAGFLVSPDAHAWAARECAHWNRPLTVEDYSGTVVQHERGKPAVVLKRGSYLVEHGLWQSVEDNLRAWLPGIVIPALEDEAA
jgi:hypothetical protein